MYFPRLFYPSGLRCEARAGPAYLETSCPPLLCAHAYLNYFHANFSRRVYMNFFMIAIMHPHAISHANKHSTTNVHYRTRQVVDAFIRTRQKDDWETLQALCNCIMNALTASGSREGRALLLRSLQMLNVGISPSFSGSTCSLPVVNK